MEFSTMLGAQNNSIILVSYTTYKDRLIFFCKDTKKKPDGKQVFGYFSLIIGYLKVF